MAYIGKYALKLGSMAMALARPTSSSKASILMPRILVKGYKDNVPKQCWMMSLLAHPTRLPRTSVGKASAEKHKGLRGESTLCQDIEYWIAQGVASRSRIVEDQSQLTIRPSTQRHLHHPAFYLDQASGIEHALKP